MAPEIVNANKNYQYGALQQRYRQTYPLRTGEQRIYVNGFLSGAVGAIPEVTENQGKEGRQRGGKEEQRWTCNA